jgi:hypothetical protein
MPDPLFPSVVPRSSRIWLSIIRAAIVIASITMLVLLAGVLAELGADNY